MASAPAPPSHALALYAEPLVAGRRVIAIDDASRGIGARLVALGARVVHVYDPNAERARKAAMASGAGETSRNLTIRALPEGEFEVRDGAFDVAVIADLGLAPEPEALLARVRKLLAEDGAALIAAHNPAAGFRLGPAGQRPFDYYELFDLVAMQWKSVRMIGQVPFVGVALAELGLDDEPDVSVDTQLVEEADAPQMFIALASQSDVKLADYAIVQLPSSELDFAVPELSAESQRAELMEAQLRANLLSAQLEEAKTARMGAASERAVALSAELEELAAKLKEADARAGEHYVRAERLAHDLREREEELTRQRDRVTRTTAELEDERRLRTRADAELSTVRRTAPAAHDGELARLREQLAALEGALAAAEITLLALRARLADAEDLGAAREAQLGAAVAELEAARLGDVADEETVARAEAAEARAAVVEAELLLVAEGHTAELAQFETSLRERARAVVALEHEVERREKIVRELVSSLDESRGPEQASDVVEAARRETELAVAEVQRAERELDARAAEALATRERLEALARENDELRGKLDALALEAARREGALASSAWRVTELEQQIARLDAAQTELTLTLPPPRSAHAVAADESGREAVREEELRRQLFDAKNELDVLRQALTQEHEARVRAESGDELTQARAELARQAVLLEQLSRELDARDRVGIAQQAHD